MTSPASPFLLPLSADIGADAIANRAINAFRSGNLHHALETALFMRRQYPALPESHVLCANILAAMQSQEESLKAWDILTEEPPLKVLWLEQAIRQALSCGDSHYLERWLSLLERMFVQPPSARLLADLTAAGRRLRGTVGIHCNRVMAWVWMPAGTRPGIEVYGGPSPTVDCSSTSLCNNYQLTSFSLELPPSDSPFFLRVTDERGADINGSPLTCEPPFRPTAVTTVNTGLPPAVIVPVYDDRKATELCLKSLMASRKACTVHFDIVVVWDHGPDISLFHHLCTMARSRKIQLLSTQKNIGFLGAVNHALRQFDNRDLVLLNADTIVHGNWFDRLHRIARLRPDAGTITPLGSNAELLSFPDIRNPADIRTLADTAAIDRACQQAAGCNLCHEIPLGIGFCIYLTRAMLQKTGWFDGYLLFSGYGEEVDLCFRAREAGFVNLAALNVFVAHLGSRSFGYGKKALVAQNNSALSRRYPDYKPEYRAFVRKDPLRSHREAISELLYAPLNAPLHIMGTVDQETAAMELLFQGVKRKDRHRATLVIADQGVESVARLTVHQRFALAEISLSLPKETRRLRKALSRLAPEAGLVHGFSRAAWKLARQTSLPMELHLNRLSRELLALWLDGQPCPADLFAGFRTISCNSREIAGWLSAAGLPAKTVAGTGRRPGLLPYPASLQNVRSFIVPTPRTLDDWKRLCNEAGRRSDFFFYIPLLDEAWRAAPRPSNIRECPPLNSDDIRLLAEAVLIFSKDPELASAWSLWAARQGIPCYITEDCAGLNRKRL